MSNFKDAKETSSLIIKKYANRRLYNTGTSRYITLDDLASLVQAGQTFTVIDARTGEDLTRAVLTQIIVEKEAAGCNLLPESFLRHLIGCYGRHVEKLVPDYLELCMERLSAAQGQAGGLLKASTSPHSHAAAVTAPPSPQAANSTPASTEALGPSPRPQRSQHVTTTDSATELPCPDLSKLQDQLAVLQRKIDALARQLHINPLPE